jgi:PHD/YefM family antitoxin component YafN of YafNO toxin-antitoxin module
MIPVPELVPISRLRQTQSEVLHKLSASPVVLMRRGEAVAVLVDPQLWNALLEELETWQDAPSTTAFSDALRTRNVLALEHYNEFGSERIVSHARSFVRFQIRCSARDGNPGYPQKLPFVPFLPPRRTLTPP